MQGTRLHKLSRCTVRGYFVYGEVLGINHKVQAGLKCFVALWFQALGTKQAALKLPRKTPT